MGGVEINEDKTQVIELWFGGITAVAAIVAIFLQCVLDGFSVNSILNGLINLAQMIVAAMVMLVAIRSILRTQKPKETFPDTLESELRGWVERSRPLVMRDENFQDGERYFMLTNHEHIFDVGENLSDDAAYKKGQFVVLPVEFRQSGEIMFHLNKSTFLERAKAKGKDADDEIRLIAARIAACINAHFGGVVSASADKSQHKIHALLLRDLTSPDDARLLVKLVDYVMTLYMVAS
jgi:hypothetical protein